MKKGMVDSRLNIWILQTFFSCCGVRLSSTALKLCSDGELPFFSLKTIFWFGLLLWLFSISRGGVMRFCCLLGEFSLLLLLLLVVWPNENVSVLLMGEIVRSGDNVMRCVIDLTGDVGDSRLLAFVSAIKRRAWSRSRAWRSSFDEVKGKFKWIDSKRNTVGIRSEKNELKTEEIRFQNERKVRAAKSKRKNNVSEKQWWDVKHTFASCLPFSIETGLFFRRSIMALAFSLISLCRESSFWLVEGERNG